MLARSFGMSLIENSALTLVFLMGFAWSATAQEASGRAVSVIPRVAAIGQIGSRELADQQPVYMNDQIRTGPDGEAQLQLRDGTRLVVGPSSTLLIERYLFRNASTASSVAISALRGSLRFITGNSAKQAYEIHTPTATIGVRGTKFDLAVAPGGDTNVLLLEGRAQVCDRGGSCIEARGGCSFVSVPRGGGIRSIGAGQVRNGLIRAQFPYALYQAGLRPGFRADVTSCGDLSVVPEDNRLFNPTPISLPDPPRAMRPEPLRASPREPEPPRAAAPEPPREAPRAMPEPPREAPRATPEPPREAPRATPEPPREPPRASAPPDPPRASPPSVEPPSRSPPAPDSPSPPTRGNPGNDKAVGRAGEAPGRSASSAEAGRGFGNGTRGRSDAQVAKSDNRGGGHGFGRGNDRADDDASRENGRGNDREGGPGRSEERGGDK